MPAFIALGACLLLVMLLAASEAALAANNRVHLRHVLQSQAASSDDGEAVQKLSGELSGDAQRFIAMVTIAGNVPLLAAASLTVYLARELSGGAAAIAWCAAAALATVVFFQIAPRLLTSHSGAGSTLWWLRPAWLLVAALRYPVLALLWLGAFTLRLFGLNVKPKSAESARESEEETDIGLATPEIRDLVESAQTSGALREENRELIESIFDFGDTRVHDVMIPRPDILSLPEDSDLPRVLATLQESGFSRLPVAHENVDHIVGVLHAKDALLALTQNQVSPTAQTLMRAPLFVTENQKIAEALATMRRARTHLAIVIDEYGGTAGLLTVEDILEELVGEIADEHDRSEQDELHIIDENTAVALATLHTEDLEDDWKLQLPIGEFDTVGGFMIEQLGRALVVGDRIELPDAILVVQSVRNRRPYKILITRKEIAPLSDDETS